MQRKRCIRPFYDAVKLRNGIMRLSSFTLLCVTGFFAIFSSSISKSPVLPLLAAYLGCTPFEVGLIASVSTFTGIIFSLPAGLLSDRFGRKKMLIVSLIVFASAPLFYLIPITIWQLALIRFYHGLATAIFIPISLALVADIFKTQRGEKLGWFTTSTLIGRFIAPMAGGSLLGMMVMNPEMGFKTVYGICAVAGILALIAGLQIRVVSAEVIKTNSLKNSFEVFKGVISNRRILWASIVEGSVLFSYGTLETFLPLYATQLGMNPYKTGILLSAQIITLSLTRPMMGRLSDKHGRIRQIFLGALFGAVSIGSLGFLTSFPGLLCASVSFGLSLSTVTSATSALIADLTTQENRGTSMGVYGSVMDIGHSLGPLLGGVVSTYYGFRNCFISSALILIIIAIFFMIKMKHLESKHT